MATCLLLAAQDISFFFIKPICKITKGEEDKLKKFYMIIYLQRIDMSVRKLFQSDISLLIHFSLMYLKIN